LTVFVPDKSKANGAAVIICPGGAYRLLAIDHEGYELAKRFNENGVTAFVLKYRLPNDSIMDDKTIAPLQDAQRAIQIVREGAAKWNLDTSKIGILGSSAGGHLASTAGTHFNMPVIENKRGTSLRPDFMVLLYPVISFGQLAHTGSAKNLLGNDLSDERIKLYSNEMQVTEKTPTTFLLHAGDDKVVKVKNSILFYEALLSKNIPAEMHLYEGGGHGFGLHNPTTRDDWFDSLINWMKASGFIK
jgi:acetyl esterase/lipase